MTLSVLALMNITQLTLQEISNYCTNNQLSIGVAESVTAGYLQFVLSQMPNAMQIFNGGITTYNIGQKVKHLGVDYQQAMDCNCVSSATAETMAINVCHLLNSKIGIAVTGYASPVPEKDIFELHAFMAVAVDGAISHTHQLKTKETVATEVQKDYVQQIITETLSHLQKSY